MTRILFPTKLYIYITKSHNILNLLYLLSKLLNFTSLHVEFGINGEMLPSDLLSSENDINQWT